MSQLQPELNREFAGLSDLDALQDEVDQMRDQLATATHQLALERRLARDVHRARSIAISQSDALMLVYKVDDKSPDDESTDSTIGDMLSSAFVRQAPDVTLPEGFAETVAKNLRVASHPDAIGDTQVSQDVGQCLSDLKKDPTFSIASAMLLAPRQTDVDLQARRVERYRLHLALGGAKPQFDNEEEVRITAEAEINGAEWRVRAAAAHKSFELIIGDGDMWNDFLHSIVQGHKPVLIDMVNRLQPAILNRLERITKGDPIPFDTLDTTAIDAIFHRIWSTLSKSKDSDLPYSPPYQNWLEVLLPALELLDPGEKPGEEYTYFKPPIEITHAPIHSDGFGRYHDDDEIIHKKKYDEYDVSFYDTKNNYKTKY